MMRWELRRGEGLARVVAALAVGAVAALGWGGGNARLGAAPINPMVFKQQFEDAKKGAEVVAQVRVLTAVCTEAAGAGKARSVTLQLSLQVMEAEKGPVKKNDVLVVSHKVDLPAGPGPRAYGYMAALRRFPFTPGAQGSVALRWDNARRCYAAVAGWVPTPNNAAIPTEVGKAYAAGDAAKPK
jgi:hypothetical protein